MQPAWSPIVSSAKRGSGVSRNSSCALSSARRIDSERHAALAQAVTALAAKGETEALRLANEAIGQVRKLYTQSPPARRTRNRERACCFSISSGPIALLNQRWLDSSSDERHRAVAAIHLRRIV
jgi:hypothetical protein